MNYSVLLQTGFDTNISKAIHSAKNAGFRNVFLTLNSNITEKEISEVAYSGLVIDSLHLPYSVPYKFLNSLWRHDDKTDDAMSLLKNGINLAHRFNIKTVVIHASSSSQPPQKSRVGLSNFCELAEYSDKKNIVMAIENIKRIDYVEYLLYNLSLHNVKFCFDVGHANSFTQNLYTYDWNHFFSRLHCVHLHDNDGVSDLHLIPGMGEIKWDLIIPKLKSAKCDLTLTAEVYYKDREKYYPQLTQDEFFEKIYNALSDMDRRYI